MAINAGYLFADNARLLRRAFNDRVREMGVTSAQARLMLQLDRNPGQNQAFYADRLEIEPITLCRMVDRMEEAGLVERHPDPADRRARLLHLTDRSRGDIARVQQAVEELMKEMLAGFAPQEQTTFISMLNRISANLSGPAKELCRKWLTQTPQSRPVMLKPQPLRPPPQKHRRKSRPGAGAGWR